MAITIDGSTGWTYSDNIKQKFGTGDDLEIFHSGANKIVSNNSMTTYIAADQTQITNAGITEPCAKFVADGAVELYYDNDLKLFTRSTGAEVTTTGAVANFVVRGKEGYGGSLTLASDDGDDPGDYARILQHTDEALYFQVYNAANNAYEDGIVIKHDAAVELYYNNAKIFETLEYGARIKRPSGGSTDLEVIGCEGQNAYIHLWADEGDDNADKWRMGALTDGTFRLYNYAGGSWETSIKAAGDGNVELYHNNSKKMETYTSGVLIDGTLRPGSDNSHGVGTGGYRWTTVYATTGSINTSDKNEKNTIVDSDLGLSFVNKLKPVSYKFNGRVRTHYGLIAQDVETTLSDISKPTSDFAGFIKEDIPDKLYVEDDEIPEGKKVGDLKTAAHTTYGLRYGEFISPLIKAVQELSAEVDTLKTKVAALEAG